jgi:hypothetical protein
MEDTFPEEIWSIPVRRLFCLPAGAGGGKPPAVSGLQLE